MAPGRRWRHLAHHRAPTSEHLHCPGRYRDGMRAASVATRTGAALQNSLVCTPQLRTARNPMAIINGGSVRVLLGRPCTARGAEVETRTLPRAGAPAPGSLDCTPGPG